MKEKDFINDSNIDYYETDKKGNVYHVKYINGYEWWRIYNKKGDIIYYKDSNGICINYEYNKRGQLINSEDHNGFQFHIIYRKDGSLLHYRDSNGIKLEEFKDKKDQYNSYSFHDGYWQKYETYKGKVYYYEDSKRRSIGSHSRNFTIYSESYLKNIGINILNRENIYYNDKDMDLITANGYIYNETKKGFKESRFYNENGQLVQYSNNYDKWSMFKYDEKGNGVDYLNNWSGISWKRKYCEDNILIHKDSMGYTLEYKDNKLSSYYYKDAEYTERYYISSDNERITYTNSNGRIYTYYKDSNILNMRFKYRDSFIENIGNRSVKLSDSAKNNLNSIILYDLLNIHKE